MRTIDCDCGETLTAANDDDLIKEVRRHADSEHADQDLSDDEIRSMVANGAYDAADA